MPGEYLSSAISRNGYLLTPFLSFLCLNLILTIPSWFAWYQQFYVAQDRLHWSLSAVSWISVDLLLMANLLFLMRLSPAHSLFLNLSLGLYLFLWIYEIYSKLILVLAHREPSLYNDVFLINDGFYLFADLLKTYWLLLLGLVVLFFGLAIKVIPLLFRLLDDGLGQLPINPFWLWITIGILAGTMVLHQFRNTPSSDAPLRTISGRVSRNLAQSMALYKQGHSPGYLTGFRKSISQSFPHLSERPNVYFFLVESYGIILGTHPKLRMVYQDILGEFQALVSPAGWEAATGGSKAPISGSGSWLSSASILSGIRIGNQATFNYLTKSYTPPLIRFFRENGYYSIILEPSSRSRPGLPLYNQYRFDAVLSLKDLSFDGFPRFGWGIVPDQYSLLMAETHWLSNNIDPVFLFFPTVSSHAPWIKSTLPPFLDKAESREDFLNNYLTYSLDKDSTFQKTRRSKSQDFLRWYPESIRYEFQVIADFMLRHSSEKSLVVIMGDHQPPLITSQDDSFDTPVHILSCEETDLQPFLDAGFIAGMDLEVASDNIAHHTFTGILINALSHVNKLAPARGSIPP